MSLETVQKIGSLVDYMNTGSGAERNTRHFHFNDGDKELLIFEGNISHGLHRFIPDDNESFSHDVNIKTSKVWFIFKFKLIGILIYL